MQTENHLKNSLRKTIRTFINVLPSAEPVLCSRGRKQHEKQIEVGNDVANQIAVGNKHIMGVMIESHLKAGRQNVETGKELVYGQSITDACLGWEDSEPLLRTLADAVRQRRTNSAQ